MKIERNAVIRVIVMTLVLIVLGNMVVLTILPIQDFNTGIFLSNSVYSLLIGGTMAIGITRISHWLDTNHPWLRNPLRRLILQVSFTVGFCLLIIFIVIMGLILLSKDSNSSVLIAESGVFMIKTAIIFVILSLLITYAITFFINWKKSVMMHEQMKREQLALQYESLKSQINPHFLFNSLNAVTSLIRTDPDKAVKFVKKLSDVFRYVLEQKDNEIIALHAELDFLDSYLFLQKIRFGENLTVNVDVPDRTSYVIPLSLQMLLENAIKHNVISKEYPLSITIRAKSTNYLEVSNKLKKKPAISSSKLGLNNIISRYEYFTKNPVIVTENESEFRVEIPLIAK